jgi:hypothetical protein
MEDSILAQYRGGRIRLHQEQDLPILLYREVETELHCPLLSGLNVAYILQHNPYMLVKAHLMTGIIS